MLAVLAAFLDLGWDRAPAWLLALAVAALAFGALGVAIGALAREVRAASLLAFMLALPVAALALVPSGAVSGALYDADPHRLRRSSRSSRRWPRSTRALNGGDAAAAAAAPRRPRARLHRARRSRCGASRERARADRFT